MSLSPSPKLSPLSSSFNGSRLRADSCCCTPTSPRLTASRLDKAQRIISRQPEPAQKMVTREICQLSNWKLLEYVAASLLTGVILLPLVDCLWKLTTGSSWIFQDCWEKDYVKECSPDTEIHRQEEFQDDAFVPRNAAQQWLDAWDSGAKPAAETDRVARRFLAKLPKEKGKVS